MPTFTAFATQSRAAGTYTSPTVSYNGVGTVAFFQIASTTWQTDDSAILWSLLVQQSLDGGTSWDEVFAFSVNPGPHLDKTGNPTNPAGEFQVEDDLGARLVRAQVTTTGTLTWGLTGNTHTV